MAGSLIPGQPLPRGNDDLVRRIEALERQQRELGPSIAKSFRSTVDSLVATRFDTFATDSVHFPVTGVPDPTVLTGTLTVPGGYDFVTVRVDTYVMALNQTGVRGRLSANAATNGEQSPFSLTYASDNEYACAWSTVTRVFALPPGSSWNITGSARGSTDTDWGVASLANKARVSIHAILHN